MGEDGKQYTNVLKGVNDSCRQRRVSFRLELDLIHLYNRTGRQSEDCQLGDYRTSPGLSLTYLRHEPIVIVEKKILLPHNPKLVFRRSFPNAH